MTNQNIGAQVDDDVNMGIAIGRARAKVEADAALKPDKGSLPGILIAAAGMVAVFAAYMAGYYNCINHR